MNVVLRLERQKEVKKNRFSEERKIAILKEVRAAATVVGTCARYNNRVTNLSWMEAQG